MIRRDDLLPQPPPKGLEVFQLTSGNLPSSHVYMEAQIFSPDSSLFLLHESATPHGSDRTDPRHRYLVCHLRENGALYPITDELGAIAPSVSPDGRTVFYLVDETKTGGGRLILKRVNIDGTGRETVLVVDSPLPGCGRRPSRIYQLSTIRSDGQRLAVSCFLGKGEPGDILWGLMVFDLYRATAEVILTGPTWCNAHPQYSRSMDPDVRPEILVQENHDSVCDPSGKVVSWIGGLGPDIHVVRDDGSDFRDLPWGRDGNEYCQGHQCWRGRTDWAITSTATRQPPEHQLIESRAVAHAGHIGSASPGAVRNALSRSFPHPCFSHFATDIEGKILVTDTTPDDQGGRVWVARLGEPGRDAADSWTCIAQPRSSWKKEAHIHPFLSPDGTMAFFNSDESGILQAYMVRGLERLWA